MRSLDLSRAKGAVLVAVVVLCLLGTNASGATAADCEADSVIRGGGGEAGAECSDRSVDRDSATQVSNSSGPAACTPERAADPNAWWVSFVPPEHVPETYRDRQQHNWLDAPEGHALAVYRDCNGELRSDLLWLASPEPGSAADSEGIFAARAQARARVEPVPPEFGVSPEQAVVRFTTWLWLDQSYWQPASATASTPAGIAVSVEARPVEATWDLDEGVRVCDGPGMPWSEAAQADYELQPESVRGSGNPACTFTFTDASSVRPSGVFDASVTVRWEFSWSLNGADQGVFGSVEISDSWELTVGEVQAVITG